MKNISEQKVFVGLSGGVDSSVAALRLKNQGYQVVGVFIKVWQPDWLECNWEQERLDAMRVAAHLDIPFLTCDAEAAYRDEVGKYFISEYEAGRTPNPDVMCNQHVKFGAFLDFATEHGADYIATGHYAQVHKVRGLTANNKQSKSSRFNRELDARFELHRGVDTNKDQSYFLWTLTQSQLSKTLLPVGSSTKDVIRHEAAAAGIPVAQKKDSQGVCFLGQINIPEFLSHYTELVPGKVLSVAGEVIGEHQGALIYTLGQRHGFTLHDKDSDRIAQFVVFKNLAANTITVDKTPPILTTDAKTTLIDCNWIPDIPNASISAQFRYRQTPFEITLTHHTNTEAELVTHASTDLPAAGQSCVLYDGERCLGGGIIA